MKKLWNVTEVCVLESLMWCAVFDSRKIWNGSVDSGAVTDELFLHADVFKVVTDFYHLWFCVLWINKHFDLVDPWNPSLFFSDLNTFLNTFFLQVHIMFLQWSTLLWILGHLRRQICVDFDLPHKQIRLL